MYHFDVDLQLTQYCRLCRHACSVSRVQLFVTPWTVAHQAPLSTGLSRLECCSGLPFPPPGGLPDPGTKPTAPAAPALVGRFFTTEHLGSQQLCFSPVQFSRSVVSDSLRPHMDCSTPGLPVHHQLPGFTQTHVHGDAIQPSHLLSSPSPPAFNLSQHQGLFQWVH